MTDRKPFYNRPIMELWRDTWDWYFSLEDGYQLAAFLLVLFLLTLMGTGAVQFESNAHHRSWCAERMAHASTPSDSLAVYQDDDFCLKVEK